MWIWPGPASAAVRAPVLMIVGGADADTLERTRASAPLLGGPSRLTVIRGAGHTFEEPGALGAVVSRSCAGSGDLAAVVGRA
ncbi:MAG: hypothetical protein U0163_10305 [Gemmatimonadaceae bacterium]